MGLAFIPSLYVWGSRKGEFSGHLGHFCILDTSDLHTTHWSPESLGEGLPEAGGAADPGGGTESSCPGQGGFAGCRTWKAAPWAQYPTASLPPVSVQGYSTSAIPAVESTGSSQYGSYLFVGHPKTGSTHLQNVSVRN